MGANTNYKIIQKDDNAFLNLKCELMEKFHLNPLIFIYRIFVKDSLDNLRCFVTWVQNVFHSFIQHVALGCVKCSRHWAERWWTKPNIVSDLLECVMRCLSTWFWSFKGRENMKWWRIGSSFKNLLKHFHVIISLPFVGYLFYIFSEIYYNEWLLLSGLFVKDKGKSFS